MITNGRHGRRADEWYVARTQDALLHRSPRSTSVFAPPGARNFGLIHRLHRAAAGFRPAITSYRFHPYQPKAGEIVSHGDLGPWNTVYKDGIPVAFIDWDAAQPVDPLADLAAAAWAFVPLAPLAQLAEAGFDPLPDLPARLRAFVDAYGLTDRTAILPALRRCKLDEPEPLHWLQAISPHLTRAL